MNPEKKRILEAIGQSSDGNIQHEIIIIFFKTPSFFW